MSSRAVPPDDTLAAMQAEALFSLSINAFMSAATGTVIAVSQWSDKTASILLFWLLINYAHAATWMVLAHLRRQPGSLGLSPTNWRSIYVLLMASAGVIWGLSGFLLIPLGTSEQALLTGLVAMGAVLAAYPVVVYAPALTAFQIPVFALCAAGYLASDLSNSAVIAVLTVTLSCALVPIGNVVGNRLVGQMRLVIENSRMIHFQEKQAFALAKANEELERLSYADALTGLLNRRKLMLELGRIAADPGSCLMIVDVDHFKTYNDTYGHGAGDACLVEVAAILQQHALANGGLAARHGGEEFCILFGPVLSAQAMRIAESIRQEVENLIQTSTVIERRVTVSIGLAFRLKAMTDSQLMYQADQSAYCAKRGGRNRVCRAGLTGIAHETGKTRKAVN